MPKKKSGDKKPIKKEKVESKNFFQKMSPRKQFWVKEIAVVLFLYLLTIAIFFPFVTEDTRSSSSGDAANATIWNLTGDRLSEEMGTTALWNPYVFLGFPTYGSLAYLGDVNFNPLGIAVDAARYLFGPYKMNDHIIYYFLSGLFVYLFARGIGLPVLASLLAGIAMLLNPYNVSLMEAGHGSKHWTIAVLPLVLLMTWRVVQKQKLLDMALLAIAVGVLLLSMHVQIAYYGLMTAGLYALVWGIRKAFKNYKETIKGWALFGGGCGMGLGLAFYLYWPIYVFSKYSIRGTSPLKAESGPTGLDWEYATNWSLHPIEMLQFIVPGLFGVGGSQPLDKGFTLDNIQNYNLYWGWMPFTQSSLYMGILVLILAIFAGIVLFRKNSIVQWLSITAVISLIISFGRFLPILYKPLYLYLPFFSKFRVPSLILSLTTICVVILAGFGLVELVNRIRKADEKRKKTLSIVFITVAVISFLGIIFSLSGSYPPANGSSLFIKRGEVSTYGMQTLQMLIDLRWIIFTKSLQVICIQLLLFALTLLIALRLKPGKYNRFVIVGMMIVLLTTIDLFSMGKRFMHPVPNKALLTAFSESPTAAFLKEQQELLEEPFRIYPLGDKYQSVYWMYQGIESIGGYSPAKLRAYQDYMDYGLNVTRGRMPNLVVAGTMNAKYMVYQGELPYDFEKVFDGGSKHESVFLNPFALPRAWFVDSVSYIEDRVALMDSVASFSFNPVKVAYLNEKPDFEIGDSMEEAKVIVPKEKYTPHNIEINATTPENGFLVVSEIYYPQGWEVFVDDQKSKVWKVNHALRGVVVPAGEHVIRFEFHPPENRAGIVTSWISLLMIVGVIGLAVWLNRKTYFPAKTNRQ